MESTNKHIINNLAKLLKNKSITQINLSNGINVSKTTINNWLNYRSKIDAVSLKKISDFLNVPVSYFFDESPAPVDNNQNTNTTISQVTNGNGNSPKVIIQANEIKSLKREIELLQDQLKEKDEIIRLLKELNSKNR